MHNCCLEAYAVSVLDILMRTMNEYASHSYILIYVYKRIVFSCLIGGCRYNLLEFYLDFILQNMYLLYYTRLHICLYLYTFLPFFMPISKMQSVFAGAIEFLCYKDNALDKP